MRRSIVGSRLASLPISRRQHQMADSRCHQKKAHSCDPHTCWSSSMSTARLSSSLSIFLAGRVFPRLLLFEDAAPGSPTDLTVGLACAMPDLSLSS